MNAHILHIPATAFSHEADKGDIRCKLVGGNVNFYKCNMP